MKTLELEKFIQGLSSPLYSFAYTLIPDDLQAGQLMIDAVQVFMIQKLTLVEKWIEAKEKETHCIDCKEEIKIHLYKSLFELSKKRFNQLKMSFGEVEQNSPFFSMDFEEKAALFLKERANFPLPSIEFVLGKMRPETLAHLQNARSKMIDHYHVHLHDAKDSKDTQKKSGEQSRFRNHN